MDALYTRLSPPAVTTIAVSGILLPADVTSGEQAAERQ